MNARAILPLYRAAREAGHDNASARRIAESEYARAMTSLLTLQLHAPTPWHVVQWPDCDDSIVQLADRRGRVVVVIPPGDSMAHTAATAARIVECVNAMRTIIDPASYARDAEDMRRILDAATR